MADFLVDETTMGDENWMTPDLQKTVDHRAFEGSHMAEAVMGQKALGVEGQMAFVEGQQRDQNLKAGLAVQTPIDQH